MSNALTLAEQAELEQQETIIARGLNTFVEVGEALLKIRDEKLYRVTYGTFEDYCREKWQMSDRHARRLMSATTTVNNLKIGQACPAASKLSLVSAVALSQFPEELQPTIVSTAIARYGEPTESNVKRVGQIVTEMATTGHVDIGNGTSTPIDAALSIEDSEAYKRQQMYIVEKQNGKHKPKENRAGDEYEAKGYDACQTPAYALDPLLPFIEPHWTIWEPACGEGNLVEALYDSGFDPVLQSDILTHQNFFEYEPTEHWDCIITNPPYSIKYKWIERCYALGKPFALLLPVETLGAKTAQVLFRQYGIKVVFLDQRVNFKMPNAGWEGSSAQFPTAWFCWQLPLDAQMIFAEIEHNE